MREEGDEGEEREEDNNEKPCLYTSIASSLRSSATKAIAFLLSS